MISDMPMGHQPISLRASEKEALSLAVISQKTAIILMTQDRVTALILARMTEGASRLRVGDGRVVEET
jgi:hypothetical protein